MPNDQKALTGNPGQPDMPTGQPLGYPVDGGYGPEQSQWAQPGYPPQPGQHYQMDSNDEDSSAMRSVFSGIILFGSYLLITVTMPFSLFYCVKMVQVIDMKFRFPLLVMYLFVHIHVGVPESSDFSTWTRQAKCRSRTRSVLHRAMYGRSNIFHFLYNRNVLHVEICLDSSWSATCEQSLLMFLLKRF